jgi:uncharacterized circularly permuted ATP-grasp superfamily protein
MSWDEYQPAVGWDEFVDADGCARPAVAPLYGPLTALEPEELRSRQAVAEADIRSLGISFPLSPGHPAAGSEGLDRAWPYCIIPRLISGDEWDEVAAGLRQRLAALNRFVADVYGDQESLADGIVPASLVVDSPNYRAECRHHRPPAGVWTHIAGVDLVRGGDGEWYVLEDNLRVPSGVSYMIENRSATKRTLGDLLRHCSVRPVDGYIDRLLLMLRSLAPPGVDDPTVAILTPGIYNSAYFEHAYLAQQLGVQLVEGRDLVVDAADQLHMRTIAGLERVDVLYRRVDDLWLDPEVYRSDSTVGAPGLLRAWLAGHLTLVNAPGAGVADDKVVYRHVPDLIRYFLGEEPMLANVETLWCGIDDELGEVLDRLDELVVKPATESGGYGIHIGPQSTAAEQASMRQSILADPDNFVAQPVLDLSTVPTITDDGIAPRHVDLRPFVLHGADDVYVTRGGLTRVARAEGSLIVNSSQGGGSKDTWIVEMDESGNAVSVG